MIVIPSISFKTLKRIKRSIRIMRIFILIKFSHLYSMRNLHKSLIKEHHNNWEEAEEISDMINIYFGTNSSPKDFMFSKEEQVDECINITEEMKSCENSLEYYGLLPQDVYAFCADVEYNNSIPLFKRYGQIVMYMMEHIVNYNLELVSKEESLKNIENLKNFKLAPNNLSYITRKIITQVEDIFEEVSLKRNERRLKKELKEKL